MHFPLAASVNFFLFFFSSPSASLSSIVMLLLFDFRWEYSATEQMKQEVLKDLGNDLTIPCNFSVTLPCYDPNNPQHKRVASHVINPQTTELCARFGLIDINAKVGQLDDEGGEFDAAEDNDAESSGSIEDPSEYSTDTSVLSSSFNPDEITLDDDDDDVPVRSVEPSLEYSPSFSNSRVLPDSMAVSSDDAMDSTNDEQERSESSQTEGEGKNPERQLKRLSDENGRGTVRIKRRNQAIYTAQDEVE